MDQVLVFRRTVLIVSILFAAVEGPVGAQTASLQSIHTPRGVDAAYILIKPEKPIASVMLFAGGHGGLGLRSASSMSWGAGNFLVRSREAFAARGFLVAVIDAPSDQKGGMNGVFRMSKRHAEDIDAIARHLKAEAAAPVWLVGTSMGTFSAVNGAIRSKAVDGLVLTSTVTRSKPHWKIAGTHPDGVASMTLSRVTVPTLVLSHRKDDCEASPAADAPKLMARLTSARKKTAVLLDGGSPPQSAPCEAKSHHGFLGIEAQAVSAIADFVKQSGK